MRTEQLDTKQWEPFVTKMAGAFAHIAKMNKATCSNQDLKQEAWLALLKAHNGFDPGRGVKFITYAYNYVYHELLKFIGKQTKLRGKLKLESPEILANVGIASPSMSGLTIVETNDTIDFVIGELTDHENTIVNERFFKESKIKDIAALTNTSSATVTNHLNGAIQKMRRVINRSKE